ncbi:MAG: hypothetical protein OXS29_03010 [bacterium]|nr:hypothetical protein [bacterium]MDE0289250.1 hypothetical protein [bacterium]MDE0437648.1 hypothetical protein [bacterium]
MVARSMAGHTRTIRGTAERTPAESVELSLLWMGRIVVVASVVLAGMNIDGIRLNSAVLLMVILYLGYVINHWEAVRTRRVEAAVLTAVAVGLAVFLVVTEMLGSGTGAEAGVVFSASLGVYYLVAAS